MPMPEPGSKAYDEMVEFMRRDLETDFASTKLIDATRELLESQGRDFDEEFDKWLKQQKEVT